MLLFQTRPEEVEVHHRLAVFAFLVDHVLGLRDPARRVGLEDHPTLPAVRHRVPGRSAERVGVHCRPGALRPDAEPAIRLLLRLGHEIEEVMREVIRDLEVGQELADPLVLVHPSLEEVERAVVLLVTHVVHEILVLHPELPALVVLAHLHRGMVQAVLEAFRRPLLHRRPMLHRALDDARDSTFGGGLPQRRARAEEATTSACRRWTIKETCPRHTATRDGQIRKTHLQVPTR